LKKSFIFLYFFTFFLAQSSIAQIDTTSINKFTVYLFLVSQDSTKKEIALKYIADSTSAIEPHTLMMAGLTLYAKGYKDSSMYWIYLGDIRARYLSSLFKQRSDAALYSSFHALAMEITRNYAKANVQTLYKKINQALVYDSLNPLNPLQFSGYLADTLPFIPVDEWKHHYEIVRLTYYHLLQEILKNGDSIFEEDKRKKTKSQ
jgi:hypothetical protein